MSIAPVRRGQIDGCANRSATAAGLLILKTIRCRAAAPLPPPFWRDSLAETGGPDKMLAEVAIVGIGSGTGTSAYTLVSECAAAYIGRGMTLTTYIHPISNFKKQWSFTSKMRSRLTVVVRIANLHVTSRNIQMKKLPTFPWNRGKAPGI